MWAEIIVAIIGFCGVIGAQLIITKNANTKLLNEIEKKSELQDQKIMAEIDKYRAVTDTKIEELTREVRVHNNFAQRMPVVEDQVKRNTEDIKELRKAG